MNTHLAGMSRAVLLAALACLSACGGGADGNGADETVLAAAPVPGGGTPAPATGPPSTGTAVELPFTQKAPLAPASCQAQRAYWDNYLKDLTRLCVTTDQSDRPKVSDADLNWLTSSFVFQIPILPTAFPDTLMAARVDAVDWAYSNPCVKVGPDEIGPEVAIKFKIVLYVYETVGGVTPYPVVAGDFVWKRDPKYPFDPAIPYTPLNVASNPLFYASNVVQDTRSRIYVNPDDLTFLVNRIGRSMEGAKLCSVRPPLVPFFTG